MGDSIYEKILSLPLLQGINQEKLTLLLEKCAFEFVNYSDQETIVQDEAISNHFFFIFRGTVISSVTNKEKSMTVFEELTAPNVLSPIYLYGRNRKNPTLTRAKGKAQILRIHRDALWTMIQNEPIVMMNLLNIVTTRSQMALSNLLSVSEGRCDIRLAYWTLTMTHRGGENIFIQVSKRDLSKLLGTSLTTIELILTDWCEKQIITEVLPNGFKLSSRRNIEAIFSEVAELDD